MNKRLQMQLAKVDLETASGREALLELVSKAYEEHDLERRRSIRANALMQEDLEELYSKLQASAATIELQNIRFQAAQDHMPQALSLFDKNGKLVVCNRRFQQMYQLADTFDPHNKSLSEILPHCGALGRPKDIQRTLLTMEHLSMSKDAPSTLEQLWPNDQTISIARNVTPDGGFLDTTSDITEARKAMAKIAHMALHDALTDLPNRILYRKCFLEAIESARRGELCALLSLDLDRFKTVNDTLGHPIGDALLIEVGARLRASVRNADTIARLGGDEFAVILRELQSPDSTRAVAQELIDQICLPYMLNGQPVLIGVSIGIAIIDGNIHDPDEPMRNADLALYQAKAEGRGTFRIMPAALESQSRFQN